MTACHQCSLLRESLTEAEKTIDMLKASRLQISSELMAAEERLAELEAEVQLSGQKSAKVVSGMDSESSISFMSQDTLNSFMGKLHEDGLAEFLKPKERSSADPAPAHQMAWKASPQLRSLNLNNRDGSTHKDGMEDGTATDLSMTWSDMDTDELFPDSPALNRAHHRNSLKYWKDRCTELELVVQSLLERSPNSGAYPIPAFPPSVLVATAEAQVDTADLDSETPISEVIAIETQDKDNLSEQQQLHLPESESDEHATSASVGASEPEEVLQGDKLRLREAEISLSVLRIRLQDVLSEQAEADSHWRKKEQAWESKYEQLLRTLAEREDFEQQALIWKQKAEYVESMLKKERIAASMLTKAWEKEKKQKDKPTTSRQGKENQ
jgi:hypothetical protein